MGVCIINYNNILSYIFEQKKRICFISTLAVISVVLSLISPILIQWFIDTVLLKNNLSKIIFAFIMIIGFRIFGEIFRSYFQYSYLKFIFEVVNKIKLELFYKLINMPYSLYRKKKERSINIFTNDVSSLLESGVEMIPGMVIAILIGIGGSIYISTIDIWFLFGVLILSAVSLWPLYYINRRQEILVATAQEAEIRQTSYITEFIDKPLFVKTNYKITFIINKFKNIAHKLMHSSLRRELNFRIFLIIRAIFDALVPAFILAYGGKLYFQDQITIGQIVGSLFILPFILDPIKNISTYFLTIKDIIPRAKRINGMLSSPVDLMEKSKLTSLNEEHVTIGMDGVSLDLEGKGILKDISCSFKTGEHILIVGSSGSGKSTLFNLLLNIYSPTSGNITVNNIPYKDINTLEIRNLFAVCLQDTFFFKGTLRENLTLMNPKATEKVINKALEISCCKDFINNLPEGLETTLEEGGKNFSGGQLQRLSIARAIISERKFLLLDESTSAVEPEIEKMILNRLYQEDITVFQISHRIDKLDYPHKLFVLKDNGIIA
ncbi:ABC transporter ATP-binding protein [Priestia filamentosa]|uniref:ABC transporter ATP-binding protein n=1 Tax=Priestia filamentosa TaxID=1402861 RepID=UPI001FB2DDC0|nr:ABC transporter ATP-binding protein [Priestia filamentosa]UOE58266.1 ABC transporter ATP-binding protein [Priestia filamentosa]